MNAPYKLVASILFFFSLSRSILAAEVDCHAEDTDGNKILAVELAANVAGDPWIYSTKDDGRERLEEIPQAYLPVLSHIAAAKHPQVIINVPDGLGGRRNFHLIAIAFVVEQDGKIIRIDGHFLPLFAEEAVPNKASTKIRQTNSQALYKAERIDLIESFPAWNLDLAVLETRDFLIAGTPVTIIKEDLPAMLSQGFHTTIRIKLTSTGKSTGVLLSDLALVDTIENTADLPRVFIPPPPPSLSFFQQICALAFAWWR